MRGSTGLEVVLLGAIAFRYGWYENKACYTEMKTAGAGLALRYGDLAGASIDWSRTDEQYLEDVDRWMLSLSLVRCSDGLDVRSLFR
jgi:hypothetical protein